MKKKLTPIQKYLSNPENVLKKKESDKKAYLKYRLCPERRKRRALLDRQRYERSKSTGNQNFY